ncbi:hypothetical protein OSTOST_06248, partial [Ostertagia ostertagi]
AFTPVRAQFVPSQQRGRDVAVYIFPDDHDLCYEWFCQLQLVDGATYLYMCCGCIIFRCLLANPKRPHFCEPRLTTKATARRLIIGKCNELRDGNTSRPAAQELDELLLRISSEDFGDSETDWMLRGKSKKNLVNEEGQSLMIANATASTISNDENPDVLFDTDKKPQTNRVKKYVCVICGKSCEYLRGQIPPFNPRHVLVLLASMMTYKNMSLDSALNINNGCSLKEKIICKAHYLEAAAPLLSRMVSTTDNIPFDTNLNTLHMNEEMVTEDVVTDLNEKMVLLKIKEKLTAKNVALFLNNTIAYCVGKRDRRAEKRVGTTGILKSNKAPKTEPSSTPPESDCMAESLLEESSIAVPESSSSTDAADDTEQIIVVSCLQICCIEVC